MMQSYASAAKLRAGGSILHSGLERLPKVRRARPYREVFLALAAAVSRDVHLNDCNAARACASARMAEHVARPKGPRPNSEAKLEETPNKGLMSIS